MKNYKPLGEYIRQVDVRNKDRQVERLVGVSINKTFIPSVANTIGTDLSSYKIIRTGQFACSLMQVSRDEKIPVAMYEGDDAIMSPAYPIFEVIDKDVLMPEYLNMWVSRAEFDREASYYAVGGVRGSLAWEDFCDMRLPVLPLAEQRRIVERYASVNRRIACLRRLIATLDDTARTIYRHTFVDGIDKEQLPEGWRMGKLGEVADCNTDNYSTKDDWNLIKYMDSGAVTDNYFDEYELLNTKSQNVPSRAKRKVQAGDVVFSTVRPNLKHYGIISGNVDNVLLSTAFAVIRSNHPLITNELIYIIITEPETVSALQNLAEQSKATYPSITAEDILKVDILVPTRDVCQRISPFLKNVFVYMSQLHHEVSLLLHLQSLLLTRLSQ